MEIKKDFENLKNYTIVYENGVYGLMDSEGTCTYMPEYIYIGRCSEYFILIDKKGNYFKAGQGYGESYIYDLKTLVLRDGKIGVKRKRKIIIPPVYDFIFPRLGNNVCLAVKEGREMLVDDSGKEVLTRVRRFGEEDTDSPFWLISNDLGFNTITKYVGHPVDDNPNVVNLDGEWVELDRVSKEEITDMLIDPTDDLALTKENLSLLYNDYSYEYGIYQVQSNAEHPLQDCLAQLEKMNVFKNTWFFVVKIWQAPEEYLSAKELRDFRKGLDGKYRIGNPTIAVGHDESLSSGEVRMLFITHYNESGWPADFEYEWSDNMRRYSICGLKKLVPDLKKAIDDQALDKYKEEEYHNQIFDVIEKLKYTNEYSWEEVQDALDFFKKEGAHYKNVLHLFLREALDSAKDKKDKECTFFLKASLWAIENGARVNRYKGKTSLELVDMIAQLTTSDILTNLRSAIIERGGKTSAEIQHDVDTNTDYWKELDRLRPDCDDL